MTFFFGKRTDFLVPLFRGLFQPSVLLPSFCSLELCAGGDILVGVGSFRGHCFPAIRFPAIFHGLVWHGRLPRQGLLGTGSASSLKPPALVLKLLIFMGNAKSYGPVPDDGYTHPFHPMPCGGCLHTTQMVVRRSSLARPGEGPKSLWTCVAVDHTSF